MDGVETIPALEVGPGIPGRIAIEGSAVSGLSAAVKENRSVRRVAGDHSDFDIGIEVPPEVLDNLARRIEFFSQEVLRAPDLSPADRAQLERYLAAARETHRNHRLPVPLTIEDPDSIQGLLAQRLGLAPFLSSITHQQGRKTSAYFYQTGGIARRNTPSIDLPTH
jgi:hypothetical protein